MVRISAILFLFLAGLSPFGPAAAETEGRITVQGSGAVFVAPDIAMVSLGLRHRANTAESAMDQVSETLAAITETLTRFAVERRDIQTSNLSLSPIFDNEFRGEGVPKVQGFEASNQITVTLRDMATAGQVISAALGSGANSLGSLWFDVSDKTPHLDRARSAAVQDAQRKAALYAEAAGVTLGPVVSISDANGGARPSDGIIMAEARMEAVPVSAGETSLSASVVVVYQIAE